MMLTDGNTIQIAVAAALAAFVLFLCLYGLGRLFSRGARSAPAIEPQTREPEVTARAAPAAAVAKGPSYAEIAAAQAAFMATSDVPEFTPAPDYSAVSMEIPANASYTQIAVATASAAQRGLKPKMAAQSHAVAAAAVERPASKDASPLLSYTAIAVQTVGEPRPKGEAAPGPQRVDYSTVDIDLQGLESYAAVAVAAARGQAAQAKTLH